MMKSRQSVSRYRSAGRVMSGSSVSDELGLVGEGDRALWLAAAGRVECPRVDSKNG